MSFSGDVKEELLSVNGNGRHCQIAELAAIFSYCGFARTDRFGHMQIGIAAENKAIITKSFTLIKKTFNIYSDILMRRFAPSRKRLFASRFSHIARYAPPPAPPLSGESNLKKRN